MNTQNAYAIVATGGKQYRVKVGETHRFEKIDGEPGQIVNLDKVLLVAEGESVTLGAPYVLGSQVTAEIVEQGRGDKIRVFKMRRRKTYRRTIGHRQSFTAVKITNIQQGDSRGA